MKTTPDVFIVESLSFHDESEDHHEGWLLSRVLKLAGRRSLYYYIRTRKELEEMLDRFEDSGFRYLHISCHANKKGIALTLDDLSVDDLGSMLSPYLEKRRVFFSACELATPRLAKALLKGTDCYSVIAPSNAVRFDEAALFWASLYHLMFKKDKAVMKRAELQRHLKTLSKVFGVNARYFSSSRGDPQGFKEVQVKGPAK